MALQIPSHVTNLSDRLRGERSFPFVENNSEELPWVASVLSREALGEYGLKLAEQHRGICGNFPGRRLLDSYRANRATLERVYRRLGEAAKNGETLTAGAEWLLDNYYVVERHAAAIKKYLPRGFYRTLPKFNSGPWKGFPRVYHVALEFIAHTDAVVDPSLAAHFVSSYQRSLELTSGELWAFPIMLRFALFENLARLLREAERELLLRRDAFSLVDEVLGDETRTGTEIMVDLARRLSERASFMPHGALELLRRLRARGRKAFMALQFLEEMLRERGADHEELLRAEDHTQAARQISVGNSLTSLTAVDRMNWREWFEEVSLVEEILRKDPARLYPRCDFETRDRVRHHVEKISKVSGLSESEVSRAILRCADRAAAHHPEFDERSIVAKYVGYFVKDRGRLELEREIDFTPSLLTQSIRAVEDHAFPTYISGIAAVTLLLVLYISLVASLEETPALLVLVTLVVAILPISELASSLVQYLCTRWIAPRPLPKLEFDTAIPTEYKTAITVHTIFSNVSSIDRAIDALEVRFLANDDPALTYILMADLPDSSEGERSADDERIINAARDGIEMLNARHSLSADPRFMLFFRRRLWNPSEGRWMGWERKRGKIEEFNRFLLGDRSTTLELLTGTSEQLNGVRFVITLDSDSQLPRDVAKKLIATIAHPVNRPVVDPALRRVVQGYALIQPRVTISLTSATASFFSHLFSGQAGLDPYTNVVSDVYQDAFKEASYVGKGIYDVKVFEQVLAGRVPENTLLSHDLFEGSFARVGLASDIELYDDFPSRYIAYSKRLHRWVRGDWQLLPWLFSQVPTASGRENNQLSALSRWKMFDNLRRSLLAPACFAALLCGWTFLPDGPLLWTVLVLLVIAFPLFTGLASAFALPPLGISIGGMLEGLGRDLGSQAARAFFAVCFLPHQAGLMLDAIIRTLYRMKVSRKGLLEWEPAERAERKTINDRQIFFKIYAPPMLLAFIAVGYCIIYRVSALPYAASITALWVMAPFLREWVSRSYEAPEERITRSDRDYLRRLSLDTWQFFDDYLRPDYHYLMPDNLQVSPNEVVAERTSPTNISLSLLTILSAYDMGFIPLNMAFRRISLTVETITKLEKYRGHLFNWYGIRNLEPLSPRYISTVDSGNLLGHLYALETAISHAFTTPLIGEIHRRTLQEGLSDLRIARSTKAGQGEKEVLAKAVTVISSANALATNEEPLIDWAGRIIKNRDIASLLKEAAGQINDSDALALRRFAKLVEGVTEIRSIIPWLEPLTDIIALTRDPASQDSIAQSENTKRLVSELLEFAASIGQPTLTLDHIQTHTSQLSAIVARYPATSIEPHTAAFVTILNATIREAEEAHEGLTVTISDLASQVGTLIREMDFSFLYDNARNLFTIGFNAELARKDQSYYDLLASEARLLSFVAVARSEVPQKHWFSLGRSLTNSPGGKALVSWSGTMFEYLMPFIVMRDFPSTLLGRTARAVVRAQMKYGARRGVPWGISESAYAGVDFEKTYQYRAFGVPGLGLKRGLSEDLVVSPYSTMLAIPFTPSPHDAVENLIRLEREGARGIYGFYESVDYTMSRVVKTDPKHVVQAFFAHHQGMSFITMNNVLNGGIMCTRFHEQALVRSAELLLHERFPERVPTIVPHSQELETLPRPEEEVAVTGLEVITSPRTIAPRVRVLSNGRYSVVVDSAGGGFSTFDRSVQLTRWREDATSAPYGQFVFIHDARRGRTWSAAYQPTCVEPESYEAVFSPGRAEFKRFDDRIFVHTEITVAPEDDVELRRITVTNLSDEERELDIVSYLEPTLTTRKADAAHPAFSKLFVRCEALPGSDAIMVSRRPRSHNEREVHFFHRVTLRTSYAPVKFYLSRSDFIGRGRSLDAPTALLRREEETTTPLTSDVDPIAALHCKVRLRPGEGETMVFVSGAGNTRAEIESLNERYQELLHVSRAFELSWSRAQVELRNHAYSARQADLFHRLAGCLLYNEASVRAPVTVLAANRLTQSALWRFGISGDLPILLVKVGDSRQTKAVQELLLAHHFLRERALEFDLVILHHNQGGYLQQLTEDLEYVVRLSPQGHLMDRPGGVFLRSNLQVSDAESTLLETVARVVIDAEIGGLAEALSVPAFSQSAPTIPRSPQRKLPSALMLEESREPLLLKGPMGGFSPDGKRYILPNVGRYLPPVPWSNVVSNSTFGFIVTESGSGYTWSENSRENRLTSWSNDAVLDPPSEAVFARLPETGEYWSVTPKPAADGLNFRVEHGFGYSAFESKYGSLSTRLTVSGALEDRVKWYSLTVTNHDAKELKLELYFYVDFVLGVTREDNFRYVVTSFDRSSQTLNAVNHYNNEFAGRIVSIGSSDPITGYTGSRLEFIGRNGELSRPATLERGALLPFFMSKPRPVKLSGQTGAGIDPCGLVQVSLVLNPREQREVSFFIAESMSSSAARQSTTRYRSPQTQRAELQRTSTWWNDLLSTIQVRTPSDAFNVMMNGWLLYQTISCRILGRSAFYQSGGAIGFRDQLQDSLALLYIRPDMVRSQIVLHASRQFREGDVQHWWHPPTGRGVRTRISDDLLWLPYAVARYIEVTGDRSILDERVSFLDGPQLADDQMESYFIPQHSNEEATVLEHCLRTFAATSHTGVHGLPLIGCGDWNDGMNEVGRHGQGESVWLAWFQIEVIKHFAPVLRSAGFEDQARSLEERSTALGIAAEEHAWDGEWYRRAFYDDGTPLGSKENDECSIDSLSQSWAVISGAAPADRKARAMESVERLLVDTQGSLIKVLTPPFDKTEKNPGYIKGYPPGIRENGGQYTHAAAWVIVAQALMKRGDRAFDLFDLINPVNHTVREEKLATYMAEPYATCGDVYSEGALRGRAGWSWYTGSSSWLYQAGVHYILGLHVTPEALWLDPVIPANWDQFSIEYRRGSRVFSIHVDNSAHVQHGVRKVQVNGSDAPEGKVRLEDPSYGNRVEIVVTMG